MVFDKSAVTSNIVYTLNKPQTLTWLCLILQIICEMRGEVCCYFTKWSIFLIKQLKKSHWWRDATPPWCFSHFWTKSSAEQINVNDVHVYSKHILISFVNIIKVMPVSAKYYTFKMQMINKQHFLKSSWKCQVSRTHKGLEMLNEHTNCVTTVELCSCLFISTH